MKILLPLIMVALYNGQSLFQKLFAADFASDETRDSTSIFSMAFGLVAGLVTLCVMRFRFDSSAITVILGVANAFTLFLYNTSLINSSRLGSYSVLMIFNLYGGIILPLIANVLFLNSRITTLQLICVAVMLVSFVFINWDGLKGSGLSKRFIIWCVLLFIANGVYGVLINVQQHMTGNTQRNEMILLSYAGLALISFIEQLRRGNSAVKRAGKLHAKQTAFLFISCACASIAVHLLLYTLSIINPPVLYTINNGGVLVVAVLLSWILFKDRLSKMQCIGIAMALVSIVLLSI